MSTTHRGRTCAFIAALCLLLNGAAPAAEPQPGQAEYEAAVAQLQARDLTTAYATMRRAAALGNLAAQAELGSFHLHGIGGAEKDPAEALRLYRLAAERGSALAMHNVAFLLGSGQGADKDPVEALRWLRRAAELGLVDSQLRLGTLYFEGQEVERDYEESRRWFELAAAQGSAIGEASLGTLYLRGYGVKADGAKALEYFRSAGERGHALSLYNVGVLLLDGQHGIAPHPAEALTWLERAANAGHAEAGMRLAREYEEGKHVAADPDQALAWLTVTAERGHAEAQAQLGERYADGRGVKRDLATARRWLTLAGQQGNFGASLRLSQVVQAIEQLAAVPADEVERVRQRAEAGESEAQRELGTMYAQGRGIARDATAARDWLGRAAAGGDAQAQYALAELLFAGTPDDATRHEAMRWLESAADAGNGEAGYELGWRLARAARERREFARARKVLERVAASDAPYYDERAAYLVGYLVFNGLGGRADARGAMRWFRQALDDDPKDSFREWSSDHLFGREDRYVDTGFAYAWLTLAVAAGETDRAERLAELDGELAPQHRAVGDALLAAWRASEAKR